MGSGPKINPPTTDEVLKRVDSLVQQNERLEKQNHELINEISVMRRALADQSHASAADATGRTAEPTIAKETLPNESLPSPNRTLPTTASVTESIVSTSNSSASAEVQTSNAAADQEQRKWWGPYTPNLGYKIANTEYGDMKLSIYSYVRYLNQRNLQPTYTNDFGVTSKPATAPGRPNQQGAD